MAAATNWSLLNARLTGSGWRLRQIHRSGTMIMYPARRHRVGDSTIASSGFWRPPHFTTENPAAAMPAPTKPPIKAWEEDEGIPKYQVMRFQTMAPRRAERTTWSVAAVGSTRSWPMVLATP